MRSFPRAIVKVFENMKLLNILLLFCLNLSSPTACTISEDFVCMFGRYHRYHWPKFMSIRASSLHGSGILHCSMVCILLILLWIVQVMFSFQYSHLVSLKEVKVDQQSYKRSSFALIRIEFVTAHLIAFKAAKNCWSVNASSNDP